MKRIIGIICLYLLANISPIIKCSEAQEDSIVEKIAHKINHAGEVVSDSISALFKRYAFYKKLKDELSSHKTLSQYSLADQKRIIAELEDFLGFFPRPLQQIIFDYRGNNVLELPIDDQQCFTGIGIEGNHPHTYFFATKLDSTADAWHWPSLRSVTPPAHFLLHRVAHSKILYDSKLYALVLKIQQKSNKNIGGQLVLTKSPHYAEYTADEFLDKTQTKQGDDIEPTQQYPQAIVAPSADPSLDDLLNSLPIAWDDDAAKRFAEFCAGI